MSFDMEPDHDEHAECRREIRHLQAENEGLATRAEHCEEKTKELRAETERLKAIVDQLTKTEDNVSIVPGMILYARAPEYDYEPASIEPVEVLPLCGRAKSHNRARALGGVELSQMYFAREAAEAGEE